MAEEIVNVVYTADTRQYTQSMSEAIQATESYAKTADNAAGKLAKVGITISKAMMTIGTGGALGAKGRMGPGVQAAAGYEQQLSLLSARAKISNQNINDLGRDVKKLARDFPIGMGNSVQQFEAVQRMGKTGKELKAVTEQMTKLGAATGEMGSGLTESMGQFSRSFQQFDAKGVSNLSDSVATLSSKFGTSASSMLDFANQIAPLGKQLGMGATEVLGFSTAFGRAGESGYRAANVFNRMLSDMERAIRTGAPQIQTYAQAVGMTTESFQALAAEDPTEAMMRFFEAVNKGGDDSIRILEDLGLEGVRTYKAIVNVASQGDLREIQQQAQSAYGTGEATRAAEEAFNGLNDSMSRTTESMNQLVAAGAQPYVKVMGDVADKTADVTGKFAEMAGSEGMQTVIQTMMIGGMAMTPIKALMGAGTAIQTGKFGLNALASSGAVAAIKESPALAYAREHRRGFGMAGMAGIAAGGMMGNPMLTALGMGAMLIGPGQSAAARMMRGGSGALLRMMNTTQGAERMGEILGVKEGERVTTRGGKLFGMSQRLADWEAQVSMKERYQRGTGEYAKDASGKIKYQGGAEYTADQRRAMETARKANIDEINMQAKEAKAGTEEARKATAAQRRLNMRSAAAFMGQRGIAGLTGVAGVGSMLGAVAGPAAIAAGGAALAGFTYTQYQKGKEASADPSALVKMANAAGLATKGLEQFTTSMAKAEKGATSTADALEVTSKEMEMVQSGEYQQAFMGVKKGRSEEDVLRQMIAQGSNQSAAVQQRIVNDVAKVMGADVAERLGRQAFREGGESSVVAAGEFSKAQGGGWGQLRYYATGRRQESIDTMQAAAENMRAKFEEDKEIYGEYYALGEVLGQGIDDVSKAMSLAVDDRTIEEAAMGLAGMGQEEAAAIKDRADELENLYKPGTEEYYTSEEAAEAAIKESDWYKRTQEAWDKSILASQNVVADLAGTGLAGMQTLSSAVEKTKEGEKSLSDLLTEYDSYIAAKEREAAVGYENLEEHEKTALENAPALTAQEAEAVRGYISYESPKAQAQEEVKNFLAAANQNTQQVIGNALTVLETERQKGGEPAAQNVKAVLDAYSGALQYAGAMEGGTLTTRQAREKRMEAYQGVLNVNQPGGVQINQETGEVTFSSNPAIAEKQREAYFGVQQEQQITAQQQRGFLMADMQRQRQQAISEREFGISSGQAREDAAKNERRQRESLQRSQARATDDFNKNNQRAQDDFNKNKQRTQDDYNKQMLRGQQDYEKQMQRSEDDYYKQRSRTQADFQKSTARATEDFNRQMARQGEEMARTMLNPMERIGAARTWSAGGLAGNLKEQNEAVKKQLEVLAKLKEQGLSQEAIDLLGLANAQNARQTISLGGMSEEEIAALNAEAGTRMDLGQQIAEEQVGYRQAYEDFAREMARQEEDFNLSLARMDEDFALSRARAAEDFQLSIARSNEDFNLSMQRQQEDFNLQMSRSADDFHLSLVRQNEDFTISIAQMWEDLETGLRRQGEAMQRSFADAKQALKDSFTELNMTDAEREAAFAQAWEGEFTGYEQYMESRLEIAGTNIATENALTGTALTTTSATAQTEMENTSGTAQTNIANTAGDARDELDTTTGDVEDFAVTVSGTAQSEIDDINTTTSTAVTGITTAVATATSKVNELVNTAKTKVQELYDQITAGIETAMTTVIDKITSKLGELPDKIREKMEEFTWLLEEKNQIQNNANEIIIKMDEESFKKTWGKMMEQLGYPPPSGGGPPPGTPGAASTYDGPLHVTAGQGSISQQWNVANSRYAAGHHTGIDVSAPTGTPLYATAAGVVTKSYFDKSYGNMVEIDDATSGINVMYGHMIQRLVNVGDRVVKGTNIGKVGSTGNSTGPHVHVEARHTPYKYGNDVDPSIYLASGAIVTGTTNAVIGEAGPEALLPLNSQGADFVMSLLKRYSVDGEWSRTREYGIQHTDNSTHIVNDSSVHTGSVTVVAADPDQFADAIRRRQARERLGSRV